MASDLVDGTIDAAFSTTVDLSVRTAHIDIQTDRQTDRQTGNFNVLAILLILLLTLLLLFSRRLCTKPSWSREERATVLVVMDSC